MIAGLKSKIIVFFIIITLSSQTAFALSNYEAGKSYYWHGQFSKAAAEFKKGLEKNPNNVNCRYFYAQSLVYLSRLDEAQKQYEKIIDQAPLSDAAKLSFIAISKIQKSIVDPDEGESGGVVATIDGIGENYVDSAQSGGKVVHWNIDKMPLKIYFEENKNTPAYYVPAVKAGFDAWLKEMKGQVSYAPEKDKAKADIIITFAPSISEKSTKERTSFISGLTTHKTKGIMLYSVDIQFLISKPNKQYFKEAEIYNTAVHEAGHALGILGHSFNTGDIMYPVSKENSKIAYKQALSQRDLNTLKLLYRLDPDISNFDSAALAKKTVDRNSVVLGSEKTRLEKKLKEAKNYVKEVPDQPLGWATLGGAYYDMNLYYDAVSSYKKSLSIDANYNSAREGLAETYRKMGDSVNALSEYNNLVSKDPANINYSVNLSAMYAANNRCQDAQKAINNLIKANPAAAQDSNVKRIMQELSRNKI